MSFFVHPLTVWALALAALALGLRERRASQPAKASANALPGLFGAVRAVPISAGLGERAAGPRLRAAVAASGFPARETLTTLAHARVALAQLGCLFGGVLALASPVMAAIGVAVAGLGFLLPASWVGGVARRRKRQIVRELPDVIDLVVLCAHAGMALEPSLRVAAERLPGALADEIATTLRALDLGTPRREAYSGMATRMDVPELTGLVGALLQADELGAPIAGVLARQAELLRAARRQDVRDHAAKAAPKVQLVVAMIMVPAALLVIMGMLVIHLLGEIGGVGGGLI